MAGMVVSQQSLQRAVPSSFSNNLQRDGVAFGLQAIEWVEEDSMLSSVGAADACQVHDGAGLEGLNVANPPGGTASADPSAHDQQAPVRRSGRLVLFLL